MAELSALELHMLQQLGYRLFVGEEEVAHRLREVKVRRTPRGVSCLPCLLEVNALLESLTLAIHYAHKASLASPLLRLCHVCFQQLQLTRMLCTCVRCSQGAVWTALAHPAADFEVSRPWDHPHCPQGAWLPWLADLQA